jgi:Extensin-like protein C-terminus
VQLYACETFTTVLAPGYNIYHYNHIHVDLMRRASGRRPCRPNAVPGEVMAAKARAQYASKMRGPAYTGSISSKASLPEAPPGEDGYVADEDGDEGVTGSIPAAAKPKSSGGFGDAISRLLGRSSPPAKKATPEDRMTHSY